MRFFLDANVLFSASKEGSNVARFVAVLFRRGEVVTSDIAREETRRNLARKRKLWLPEFERLCTRITVVPSVHVKLDIMLNAKDMPILSAAIHSRCSYFITGDRNDFRHLFDRDVDGVKIVTLLRLAEILTGKPC